MVEQIDWPSMARGILRAELKRRNLRYRDLSETERNLVNKVSRGTFTTVFLLPCLNAMGVRTLRLGRPVRRQHHRLGSSGG
jgi:uncharacterized protein DUF6471